MGLDATWQQIAITSYQVWVWLKYEASLHPFMSLVVVIVIVAAWGLLKSEVRTK